MISDNLVSKEKTVNLEHDMLTRPSPSILHKSIRIGENKYSGKGKNEARQDLCFRSIGPTTRPQGDMPGWRSGISGRVFFLGATRLPTIATTPDHCCATYVPRYPPHQASVAGMLVLLLLV